MARLFISQEQLDRWTAEGKVALDGDVMRVEAMARSFRLSPAVHFVKMIDGADSAKLIGRVKSVDQVIQLKAEHYGSSVIMGDIGYECTEGFLGVPVDGRGK